MFKITVFSVVSPAFVMASWLRNVYHRCKKRWPQE